MRFLDSVKQCCIRILTLTRLDVNYRRIVAPSIVRPPEEYKQVESGGRKRPALRQTQHSANAPSCGNVFGRFCAARCGHRALHGAIGFAADYRMILSGSLDMISAPTFAVQMCRVFGCKCIHMYTKVYQIQTQNIIIPVQIQIQTQKHPQTQKHIQPPSQKESGTGLLNTSGIVEKARAGEGLRGLGYMINNYAFGFKMRFRILLVLKMTLTTSMPSMARCTFSSLTASAMTVS